MRAPHRELPSAKTWRDGVRAEGAVDRERLDCDSEAIPHANLQSTVLNTSANPACDSHACGWGRACSWLIHAKPVCCFRNAADITTSEMRL